MKLNVSIALLLKNPMHMSLLFNASLDYIPPFLSCPDKPASYLQQIKQQVGPTCIWLRAGGGGGGGALKTGESSSDVGALLSTGAQFP